MTNGIKAIAEKAGVSISTVSRVLSGQSVRTRSREKVEAALRAIDYRPNLTARRLRSRRPQTVGLVVADITNRFFVDLARELNELAWTEGLNVLIADSREEPTREARCLSDFEREGVSGILLAPSRADARPAREDLSRPLVLLDRAPNEDLFDCVALDNARAVSELVDNLAARGCRRIAGVFRSDIKTGLERSVAFRERAQDSGIAAEATMLPFDAEVDPALLVAAEGVVAGDARLLLSAASALHGVVSPPILAGFDVPVWAPLYREPLIVIEQPVAEIAHVALALLLHRIAEPDRCCVRALATGSVRAVDR